MRKREKEQEREAGDIALEKPRNGVGKRWWTWVLLWNIRRTQTETNVSGFNALKCIVVENALDRNERNQLLLPPLLIFIPEWYKL
jgi:hypothetical protein